MIDISKVRYPEMNRILLLYPNPHILLGREIFWTVKEDGSNIGAYVGEDGEVHFRSRNMDKASEQFYKYVKETEEFAALREMLLDAPNWGDEYVIFGELLVKGKSPTRMEIHEKTRFVVFDIWSSRSEDFMNYTQMHQHCYHFELPCVELLGTCKCTDIETLYEFKDQMLDVCKEIKKEGTVGKTWGSERIYFKEKLDTPRLEKLPRVVQEGGLCLQDLPESEIRGAVDKALVDLGEDFKDVRKAMPLIARLVNEEASKHNCTIPKGTPLFVYYKEKLEDLKC